MSKLYFPVDKSAIMNFMYSAVSSDVVADVIYYSDVIIAEAVVRVGVGVKLTKVISWQLRTVYDPIVYGSITYCDVVSPLLADVWHTLHGLRVLA